MLFIQLLVASSIAGAAPTASVTTPVQSDTAWSQQGGTFQAGPRLANKLRVGGDALIWNGERVSDDEMEELLDRLAARWTDAAVFILEREGAADADRYARIKAMAARKLECTASRCIEIAR